METTTELLSRIRKESLFKTDHEEKLFADDANNQVKTAAQVIKKKRKIQLGFNLIWSQQHIVFGLVFFLLRFMTKDIKVV